LTTFGANAFALERNARMDAAVIFIVVVVVVVVVVD